MVAPGRHTLGTDWFPVLLDDELSVLDLTTSALQVHNAALDHGADPSGNNDSWLAIQTAILEAEATASAAPGVDWTGSTIVYVGPGLFKISQPLRIRKSNVRLIGAGGGHNHNVINPLSPSTTSGILWGGSFGGTMIEVMPDTGQRALRGVVIEGISLHGSPADTLAIAGKGLHVRSVCHSRFSLYVERTQQACVYCDCYHSNGTNGGINEVLDWGDTQDNYFDIEARQVLSNCGPIMEVHGDDWDGVVNSADFSLNHQVYVRGSYGGGATAHGLVIGNSDNNTINAVDVFDQSGATNGAYGLKFLASAVSGAVPRHNVVRRAGPGGDNSILFEGTNVASSIPIHNTIEWRDMQGVPGIPAEWGPGTNATNRVWLGQAIDGEPNHWDHPFSCMLNEDVVTTSTSFVDIDGPNGSDLSFPVRPGYIYQFDFMGDYEVAGATTGLAIGITAPAAGGSVLSATAQIASTGPATFTNERLTANDTATGTTTTDVANTRRPWRVWGTYVSGAQGTFQLRFKRQGTNANVTIRAAAAGTINWMRSHA